MVKRAGFDFGETVGICLWRNKRVLFVVKRAGFTFDKTSWVLLVLERAELTGKSCGNVLGYNGGGGAMGC